MSSLNISVLIFLSRFNSNGGNILWKMDGKLSRNRMTLTVYLPAAC